MKRVLITGGCGFIGHHLVEAILKLTDWQVVVLDRLSYAARGFDRLRDISVFDDKRVQIFTADISQPLSVGVRQEIGSLNYIVHTAAETHVDNSIANPEAFIHANVVGTFHMLEYARSIDIESFLYFSTDEVFGPAPVGTAHKEWDRYNSTNPYSATKAAGEELALAWANTYKLPVIITHTMNVFGERQHPEKFIPMCIRKILAGETVTIHASADKKTSGSRFYIHARNVASAVLLLLGTIASRSKFNIVGEREVSNLDLAVLIALQLRRALKYEMVDFHSSRPGHDLRYALDGGKLRELGWVPPVTFEVSLAKTVRWFLAFPKWLELSK
jgi:dTDP-glucose 4,6-dehydratase